MDILWYRKMHLDVKFYFYNEIKNLHACNLKQRLQDFRRESLKTGYNFKLFKSNLFSLNSQTEQSSDFNLCDLPKNLY